MPRCPHPQNSWVTGANAGFRERPLQLDCLPRPSWNSSCRPAPLSNWRRRRRTPSCGWPMRPCGRSWKTRRSSSADWRKTCRAGRSKPNGARGRGGAGVALGSGRVHFHPHPTSQPRHQGLRGAGSSRGSSVAQKPPCIPPAETWLRYRGTCRRRSAVSCGSWSSSGVGGEGISAAR